MIGMPTHWSRDSDKRKPQLLKEPNGGHIDKRET